MPIDPGRLNSRVKIQSDAKTSDGAGGFTLAAPALVAEVWANVEPLEGDEQIAAMQTEARATHRVTMRYREDVKASMRLLLGARVLEIVGAPIDTDERHSTLTMLCRERV